MRPKKKPDGAAPSLVYFEDRGAVYDAPLDVVWDFLEKDETFHPQAHRGSVRNFKARPLSEVTVRLSWEELRGRTWQRRNARFTTIRPALRIKEDLDGPCAGSTQVFLYSPRGRKTIVDVLCYMRSAHMTPKEIERMYRRVLAGAYREDQPWFADYVRSRKGKK